MGLGGEAQVHVHAIHADVSGDGDTADNFTVGVQQLDVRAHVVVVVAVDRGRQIPEHEHLPRSTTVALDFSLTAGGQVVQTVLVRTCARRKRRGGRPTHHRLREMGMWIPNVPRRWLSIPVAVGHDDLVSVGRRLPPVDRGGGGGGGGRP